MKRANERLKFLQSLETKKINFNSHLLKSNKDDRYLNGINSNGINYINNSNKPQSKKLDYQQNKPSDLVNKYIPKNKKSQNNHSKSQPYRHKNINYVD